MTPTQQIGYDGWSGRKSPSDVVFPSMSTLAGNTLASPALENWAIEATAQRVVEQMGTLAHRAVDDPGGTIEEIKGLRFARPDGQMTASQRGTFLHEVLENWLHGEAAPKVPPGLESQLQPSIDALAEWMRTNRPRMIASEQAVYNDHVGAAGRFDGVLAFEAGPHAGVTGLIDLKTKGESKTARGYDQKVYGDSVALQLAGYKYAEHYATFKPRTQGEKWAEKRKYGGRVYLLNDAERGVLGRTEDLWGMRGEEMRTFVILLTPDWCRTHEIDTGPDVLDALKAVRAAWQWKFVDSNDRVHPEVAA